MPQPARTFADVRRLARITAAACLLLWWPLAGAQDAAREAEDAGPGTVHIMIDRQGTTPFRALGELIAVFERLGRGGLADQTVTLGELLEALLRSGQADPYWRELVPPELLTRQLRIAVRQDAGGALSVHLGSTAEAEARPWSPALIALPEAVDADSGLSGAPDSDQVVESAVAAVTGDVEAIRARRGEHVILLTGRDDGAIGATDVAIDLPETESASLFGPADVPPGPERRLVRQLTTLLPRLETSGLIFHTLSLGSVPGLLDLRRLAVGSGGLNAQVYGGDDFLRLLLTILSPDYTPYARPRRTDDGWQVAGSVSEMTLYWNDAGEATLFTPAGQPLTRSALVPSVHWQVVDGVQFVTVLEPAAGLWRLEAGDPGAIDARAVGPLYVWTESLPTRIQPGLRRAVTVSLHSDGEPVDDPRVLQRSRLIAHLEEPLGAVRNLLAHRLDDAAGHWRVHLGGIDLLGDHWLFLQAIGPSFIAAQHHPLVSESLIDTFMTHVWREGEVWGRLILTDAGRALVPTSVKVRAFVEAPNGERLWLSGEPSPEVVGEWWLELPPIRGSLGYLVDLRIEAERPDGTPVRFSPPVFEVAWPFPTPEIIPPELIAHADPPVTVPAGELADAAVATAPGGPRIVDVDAALAARSTGPPWLLWVALLVLGASLTLAVRVVVRPGALWVAGNLLEQELALARTRLQVALGLDADDLAGREAFEDGMTAASG